jgi:tetratricopeptide (TPR) repeat protein
MRLARGDADGAILLLRRARERGPRFADPLELWGEALMRKGDLEGAAAKFAEAARFAPRWGRDHLLWGEALGRLGKFREAKAQWHDALGMDLSTEDRGRLAGLLKPA